MGLLKTYMASLSIEFAESVHQNSWIRSEGKSPEAHWTGIVDHLIKIIGATPIQFSLLGSIEKN